MRRLLVLAVVSLAAIALAPIAGTAAPLVAASPTPTAGSPATATPQPTSEAPTPAPTRSPTAATVTATGVAIIPSPDDPVSVYAVQLMGPIDPKDSANSFDAYVAKLERIRQAVITAGVPAASVTSASFSTQPTGAASGVSFNSLFRYEVKTGNISVAAAQAAFAAGASMVYNNMPTAAIGVRRPEPTKLDAAIAQATAMARDYAARAAGGRTIEEAVATTIVVKGEPDNAPTQWRVELTITFAAR